MVFALIDFSKKANLKSAIKQFVCRQNSAKGRSANKTSGVNLSSAWINARRMLGIAFLEVALVILAIAVVLIVAQRSGVFNLAGKANQYTTGQQKRDEIQKALNRLGENSTATAITETDIISMLTAKAGLTIDVFVVLDTQYLVMGPNGDVTLSNYVSFPVGSHLSQPQIAAILPTIPLQTLATAEFLVFALLDNTVTYFSVGNGQPKGVVPSDSSDLNPPPDSPTPIPTPTPTDTITVVGGSVAVN